jgi:hypothetical protein
VAEEIVVTEEVLAAEAPPPAEPTISAASIPAGTPTPESGERYYAPEATAASKVPEVETEAAVQDHALLPTPEPELSPQPIPPAWQIGLFSAALIFGLAALFLYWNSQRKFQRKLKKQK